MSRKQTHQNWTTKEIKILIKLRLRGLQIKECARLMKRPFWSAAKKLAEHKIYKPGRARLVSNQYEERERVQERI